MQRDKASDGTGKEALRVELPGIEGHLWLDPEGAVVRRTQPARPGDSGVTEAWVADLHLGKGTAFRRAGVAIPRGGSEHDIKRLRLLVHRHGVQRLWILGDLIHAGTSWSDTLDELMSEWRTALPDLEVRLLLGNHDRRGGTPPASWGFQVIDTPVSQGGIQMMHEPEWSPEVPAFAGHLHPVVRLPEGRGRRLQMPCFWWHRNVLVLPAFGTFTGGAAITPHRDDRVFAVGPDQVVEIPVTTVHSRRS